MLTLIMEMKQELLQRKSTNSLRTASKVRKRTKLLVLEVRKKDDDQRGGRRHLPETT
jgi:hypothetical protein